MGVGRDKRRALRQFSLDRALFYDPGDGQAFVNVANYAYGAGTGPVTLSTMAKKETGTLTVSLTDNGTPFNPLEREDPDLSLPAEEREIGGLGIFMVKKNMDEVGYDYKNGQNILTMRKTVR